MKVISGTLKGRIIKGYNIEGTRPTMDRVKESLFASINSYVKNSIVLDLFAGTGNLGIEAISNGAQSCYFVDNNKICTKVIEENITNFDIKDKCTILNMDYNKSLNYFKDSNIKFDLILVDPPYKYEIINEVLSKVEKYDLLNDNGIIVLEYQNDVIEIINTNYKLLKSKRYGDKYISIYKFIQNN